MKFQYSRRIKKCFSLLSTEARDRNETGIGTDRSLDCRERIAGDKLIATCIEKILVPV
jgi:hypothetical protein